MRFYFVEGLECVFAAQIEMVCILIEPLNTARGEGLGLHSAAYSRAILE
jgi:hypothetical protein